MKNCNRCHQDKDESEFDKSSKRYDGLQTFCRSCKKQWDAAYYQANKTKCLARTQTSKTKRLEWLAEYKATLKCKECGESHVSCLDFHHRDKDTKVESIANLIQRASVERIQKEIDKCDVLCANCHRKLHYQEKHGTIA